MTSPTPQQSRSGNTTATTAGNGDQPQPFEHVGGTVAGPRRDRPPVSRPTRPRAARRAPRRSGSIRPRPVASSTQRHLGCGGVAGGPLGEGEQREQLGGQLVVAFVVSVQLVAQRHRLGERTFELAIEEQTLDAADVHLQTKRRRAEFEREESRRPECGEPGARFAGPRSHQRQIGHGERDAPRRVRPSPTSAARTRTARPPRRTVPAATTPRRDCSPPSPSPTRSPACRRRSRLRP